MRKKKTNRRGCDCENFQMASTWRTTYTGVYCEGVCKNTGNVIHNHHYACKDYFPINIGKLF